jgi:phosphoglucomutase
VTTIKVLAWAEAVRAGKVHWLDDAAHKAYIDLCRKQALVSAPRQDEIKVVFTPLHGVGAMTAMETLVAQGFRVLPVAEQMEPNGQFPHVTQSPNPEVPASMDRAEALANRRVPIWCSPPIRTPTASAPWPRTGPALGTS